MAATLTDEDGSGDPEANSYIEVEWADTYHENRGNAYWEKMSRVQQENCLIKATDYIDKRFVRRFRGFRMQKDQALAWPRLAAFDDDDYTLDEVPSALQKATAEYALRAAIYNVLAPDAMRAAPAQDMTDEESPNSDQTNVIAGAIKFVKKVVGPIEKTIAYESTNDVAKAQVGSSRSTQSNIVSDFLVPQYPEADMLIESLLIVGGSVGLERA